ncbi:MAG TPA: LCP family protein, partial [Candidatus Saccharibacteria bacterium]|nr:LCP family protein [Candidatus Saccharibacteria bacterium]
APKQEGRIVNTGDDRTRVIGVADETRLLSGTDNDLTQSLNAIDEESRSSDEPRKKIRGGRGVAKPKNKTKRIIKWVVLGLILIGLLVGGYVLFKFINAGHSIFKGSIFDLVQSEPLRADKNGRSNFVIFGTSEDRVGEQDGPDLTDTILVVSVHQEKKDAFIFSLPRDLWVAYEEPCFVGYQGRINAVYYCGKDAGNGSEEAGAIALQHKVGEVTGLDIQYYVHVNFTAVKDLVDAVDGVSVTIEGFQPGYDGILDRAFDDKCNFTCYYVNYKDGEVAHLDGEHALALARARNAFAWAGGEYNYGLPNSNYDREKNQQKILIALREKALAAGTLTNVGKVTSMFDALGKNLRTNIELKEIRTLMSVASEMKPEQIMQLSLVGEDGYYVKGATINGASVQIPTSGNLNFTSIKDDIDKNLTADHRVREAPHVTVLNGGGPVGIAQTEANKLEDKGFIVDQVGNAEQGNYSRYTVYQLTDEKPGSAAVLKSLYGVDTVASRPSFSVVGSTDFVVIIGPED